jgi:Glycosyl hydrolases family 16
MNLSPSASHRTTGTLRQRTRRLSVAAAALITVSMLAATTPSGATPHAGRATQASTKGIGDQPFPVGVRAAHEPSGIAPPSATALAGYRRTYTQDFAGHALPKGWGTFDGVPEGDNQSHWLPSHVVVSSGLVRLIASKDASGQWVTGGVSQFSVGRAYGAYFIRSRVTGPGPDQNEMLWPVAPVWPPEVDFNEMGYSTKSTSWTVHYGHGSAFTQTTRSFNMERWHTWGLIWTPKKMTFIIDGHSWGTLTNFAQIPHQKMMLDVQQQVWCHPRLACPTRASALEVDWVAEYVKK